MGSQVVVRKMQERAQHKSLVRRHRYTGGGRVAAVSLPIRFQQGVTWDRARDLRTPRGGVYLGGHDALPEGASELHVIIEAMVLEGFQRVSAVGENGHSGFLGAAGSRIRCGAMSKVSTQLTFNEGCGHAPISVMQQFDNSKGARSHQSLAGSRAKSKRLLLSPRRSTLNRMEGRCQCGQVTFRTPSEEPQQLLICHCTECRHQSSSTYGMTATFPYFDILAPFEGAIAVYARPNTKGETRGFFCTKCGARLMHQSVSRDGTPAASVSVKSGCLDGITKEMMRSAKHIWTKSAIIDIPDNAEAYEEEPPGGSFR